MYKYYVLTTIFLIFHPQFSLLKSIPKNEDQKEVYNVSDFDDIYDQRQNGTYNVRIGIDGVDVLLQPKVEDTDKFMGILLESAIIGYSKIVKNIRPYSTESSETLDDFFTTTPTESQTTEMVSGQKFLIFIVSIFLQEFSIVSKFGMFSV